MPSPIVFFTYNRPAHAREALQHLAANPEAANSLLYIFCDGPKPGATTETRERINEVRRVVREQNWCGEVIITERETNAGLAASVMEGVTRVINKHGRCIVLEDDLCVSPFFLQYMNRALEKYETEEQVICIHGYTYPVEEKLPETFFIRGADCWGWATWKRGWQLFEPDGKKLYRELKTAKLFRAFNFNHSYDYVKMLRKQIRGENDSWAIRWYATAFLHNKLTLYPGCSLVRNTGADGQGTHVEQSNRFDVALCDKPVTVGEIPVKHSTTGARQFEHYFRKKQTTALQRLLMRLKY
jgi:hypothetical protein